MDSTPPVEGNVYAFEFCLRVKLVKAVLPTDKPFVTELYTIIAFVAALAQLIVFETTLFNVAAELEDNVTKADKLARRFC